MRTPPPDGPVVLAVCYPTEWFGGDEAIAEVARAVEALDPRVEVLTVVYEEGQAMRTLRGSPDGTREARALAPALVRAKGPRPSRRPAALDPGRGARGLRSSRPHHGSAPLAARA